MEHDSLCTGTLFNPSALELRPSHAWRDSGHDQSGGLAKLTLNPVAAAVQNRDNLRRLGVFPPELAVVPQAAAFDV